MENKNEQSTASSLLRFAGPYKGRYALSICLSVLGVASGLVPYYAAAQMLIGLIGTERSFSFYIFWGTVAAVGYLAKSTFAIDECFPYSHFPCASGYTETNRR